MRKEEKKHIGDKSLAEQVEKMARDIEVNERNYSDIDLIFEKKYKE